MHSAHRRTLALTAACLVLAAGFALADHHDGGMDAEDAFDVLKSLAGTWAGEGSFDGGEAMEGVTRFEVSAAGTVVMETMHPGTAQEMINMYHLDGEDLVLTHYCAGGNQPTMKLDRARASAGELPFVFTGGTNLDPDTDTHIHQATLRVTEDGKLDATWTGYSAGKPAGDMRMVLTRGDG